MIDYFVTNYQNDLILSVLFRLITTDLVSQYNTSNKNRKRETYLPLGSEKKTRVFSGNFYLSQKKYVFLRLPDRHCQKVPPLNACENL